LQSSYLAPLTLAVIAALLVGIRAQLLARAGAFHGRSTRNRGVVTGSGKVGNGAQVQKYVRGAVVSPGVHAVPQGARALDLVAAAGGATADADLTRVSLAGALADGRTVYVKRVGDVIPATLCGKLTITTAGEQDFRYASGVTADSAQRIVAYRTAHGPLTAVSQLLLAPTSPTDYERLRLHITV
jgi:competence protein ComEA